jgi:hypothetical protein
MLKQQRKPSKNSRIIGVTIEVAFANIYNCENVINDDT